MVTHRITSLPFGVFSKLLRPLELRTIEQRIRIDHKIRRLDLIRLTADNHLVTYLPKLIGDLALRAINTDNVGNSYFFKNKS